MMNFAMLKTRTVEVVYTSNFVKNKIKGNIILSCGFSACEQTENVLDLLLDDMVFDTNTACNIKLRSLDVKEDLYKHHHRFQMYMNQQVHRN